MKKFNDTVKSLFEESFQCAGIGVWKCDFTKRVIELYNYQLLGLESNRISFDDYLDYVRDDYRNSVLSDITRSSFTGVYERDYPVITLRGEVWINSKSFKIEKDNDGNVSLWGVFKIIEDREQISQDEIKNNLFRVVHKQNSIALFFLSLLKSNTIDKDLGIILKEIMDYYGGARCYVCEYDMSNNSQNCLQEVVAEGYDFDALHKKGIPLEKSIWWNNKILSGIPILINDVDDLSDNAKFERGLMQSNGIKSVIAIPLPSKDGVWGYLGLDIVGKERKWTNIDYQWLSGTAMMLSAFLELYKYEKTSSRLLAEKNSKELLLMTLFRGSPVGIELYDEFGTLIEINQKDMEIFGIESKNDVIGINIFDNPVFSEDILDKLRRHEDVSFKMEYDLTKVKSLFPSKLDGTKEVVINITSIFSSIHVFSHYLAIVVDNSNLSNIASKMRDFENIFSVASDFAKIGYAKWDITKKEGNATKQWFLNWGETEDVPVEKVVGYYSHVHPEDREKLISFMNGLKVGVKNNLFTEDIRVEDGKGGWKWIHSTTIFKDNVQGVLEVIGLNFDVTSQKESEMMLIEAKNKAETMDRLKSAFLANMSHEIRTPLNAIIGFANLLATNDDGSEVSEEKQYYIDIIKDNSDLLLQLISDILDLSKIEAGTLDFFYGPTNINVLCTDLYNVQKTKTQENVTLKIDLPLEQCIIHSDKNRVMQVLINFVTNAIKFTSNGSITIGYRIVDNMIEIFVEDTGMGISNVEAKLVFDSFVKLNNSIKGTGLGLAICKSIVEQMGGQIGVSSKVNKGSRFWFRLPYIPDTNENILDQGSHYTSIEASATDKKPVILIAEDNEGSFVLVSTILKKKYDVYWAQNGAIAIDMYHEKRPDLIIMDVRMPEMDGLSAAKEIRSIDKKIPIVALTAFAFSSDREEAIKSGYDEFLTKPVSSMVLKDTIKRLLEKGR